MATTIRKRVERYDIDAELGQDDLTIMYSGRRKSDNLPVIIRVVAPQFAFDSFFINRLRDTVTRSMNLRHANIVKVYEVGEKDDIVFITREVVEGQNLADYIYEHGAIPLNRAINLLQQLASALDYAHKQGIKHGDLSDKNVFISEEEDHIWVTDFGFLMAMDGTSLVKKGFALGNPAYLSPERVRGEGSSRLSDLYALGMIAYQMLTGDVPFNGETSAILHSQVYDTPPSPREVNPRISTAVSDAVMRMISKGLEFRYRTGSEFVSALRATSQRTMPLRRQSGDSTGTSPQQVVTKQILPWSKRLAFWLFVITPLISLALAAGFWATNQWLAWPINNQPVVVSNIDTGSDPDLTPIPLLSRLNLSLDQATSIPVIPLTPAPESTPTPIAIAAVETEPAQRPTPESETVGTVVETEPTVAESTVIEGVGGGNDRPVTGQAPAPEIEAPLVEATTLSNDVESVDEGDEVTTNNELDLIEPIVAENSPFSQLLLANDISNNYQPINPTNTFRPTNQPIYLFFDYNDIANDTPWKQVWRWGDTILQQADDTWPEEYGAFGTAWIYFAPVEGFRPGPHTIELMVNDEVVASIEFVVQAGN